MKFLLKFLFLLLFPLIICSYISISETKSAISSGAWSNPAIWNPAGVPGTNDDVIISQGTSITVDINTNILNTITIEVGATLQGDGNGRLLNIGNGTGIDFVNQGILNASGTNYLIIKMNANSEWSGNGLFNCTSIDLNGYVLTFSTAGTITINLSGSPDPFLNPGTIISGSTTVLNFNGTSEQIISGNAISNYNSLTITNPAGVTLGTNTTVSGSLNLNEGIVTTNSYVLILTSTCTVNRTNGYVNGNLQKYVDLGPVVINFEVGDLTAYSPISLHFDSVTTAGNLIASSHTLDHPAISNSIINPAKSVNRYWSISNQGIGFSFYDATFNFVSTDLDIETNPDAFIVEKFNGSEWSPLQTGLKTSSSTQILNTTDFSDFAIGEIKTYSITASASAHGTISPVGTIIVPHGSDQSFTITPDVESYLDSLVVDGIHVDSTTSYTFKNVTADHTISAYFSLNTYRLDVISLNGNVIKSPDQTLYEYGSTVQLTAVPATGYHFVEWSGDITGSSNPVTIIIDGNKSVTTNFAINTYTLNVSGNNGTFSKSPDQTTYEHGTTVQLTAIPDYGYHFVDWGGDASGSLNPLTIVMDGNKVITGNFEINTYTINATSTPHGTINPEGLITLNHGSNQNFILTPDTGCQIDSLLVDGIHVDSTNSYTFYNIVDNHTISTYFSLKTFTVITSATNGSIQRDPDQTLYNYGTTVLLTAVPNTGYHFIEWGGDTSGNYNPIILFIDRDRNISASFEINTYTLTVNSTNGIVIKNPDQTMYNHGTNIQLTAIPVTGYHFTGWSGDISDTLNPVTISMDGNKNITANFAINTYNLAINSVNGVVIRNPDQAVYNHGTTVELTATPNTGYHFMGWSGDASGFANPLTITMDGNKTITANFEINTYTLTVSSTYGTITKNPDQTTYNHGTAVQLTAVPNTGYNFVNWGGDTSGSVNPITIIMDGNKNITANFAINTYTLTTNATNGSITRNPNQASYTYGTNVQLSAVPNAGYHFVNWSGDTTGSANPLTITMDGNKNITAVFAINTYTLNITATNGSVTKFPNQTTYNHGTTVQLNATPNYGYRFANWSGDASGSTNPITILMNSNKNIIANFEPNLYTLTIFASNGSVTKFPNRSAYEYGTSVQLTAVPNVGYHFVNWGGNASGSENPITITIDGNKVITANFAINVYSLNVTSVNGTVLKNPNQITYTHGTTVRLTAIPNTGYHFTGWGGDATGSNNPLNVTMNSDKNITANFAIDTYSLNVSVLGNGSISINPDQAIYEYGTIIELTASPSDTNWGFSRWSGDLISTKNPVTISIDNNKNIIATFAPNAAYDIAYRSISAENLALDRNNKGYLNKFVKRKPDKVEFRFMMIADSARELTLEFSKNLRTLDIIRITNTNQNIFKNDVFYGGNISGLLTVDTIYKNNFYGNIKEIYIKFEPAVPLLPGDTMLVHGFCETGNEVKVKYRWTGSDTKYVPYFIMNQPRLPMPNRVNILYETFIQGGFYGTGGLTVGLTRFDSSKYYGWFQTQKYSDILRTLIISKTSEMHKGRPRGFDLSWSGKVLLNQIKVLPPNKHDNILLAEMIALKLNIFASAMGKLPRGFGELIYGDETDNPLNGMTVKEIAQYGDVLITGRYQPELRRKTFTTSAEFENLAQTIHRINNAFEGQLDTVAFADSLVFKGLMPLRNVSYLHANPFERVTIISPLITTVSEKPDIYNLYQNYPNPFNPTTTIEFELKDDAIVTLKVYNILGQEVSTLIDHEFMESGVQGVEFNGSGLASGIYFYRLNAEGKQENDIPSSTVNIIKKMILLK